MGDWLKDWEEQNYRREMESQVRKRNELLAEQNSVLESEARKRSEFLEKQNLAQKEFNRLQRERLIAEEKRYQRERLDRQHKEYRDKIDALKLTLAQTTDPLAREQVASLLEEAKQEYQDFLYALERQRLAEEEAEREAYQEYLRQEAERERQEKRRKRRQYVKTLILLPITILFFILGTKWLMDIWPRGEQTDPQQLAPQKSSEDREKSSSQLEVEQASEREIPSSTSSQSSSQSIAPYVSQGETPIPHSSTSVEIIPSGRVDTKNLTSQEMKDWVIHDMENRTKWDDMDIQIEKKADGLAYAELITSFDGGPQVTHYYRISEQGYLERKENGDWQVVSKEYPDF